MPETAEHQLHERMQQLDGLLHEIDAITDSTVRDKTARIIQDLLEFHGAALRALLDRLQPDVIEELADDELIGSVLLLYDLHPADLTSRINLALDKVRPYLSSHGGNVELLNVSKDGVVHLSMQGSCHGCPSSAITLKQRIERAIYESAPDVTGIEVEDQSAAAPEGFVPVATLIENAAKQQLSQGAIP